MSGAELVAVPRKSRPPNKRKGSILYAPGPQGPRMWSLVYTDLIEVTRELHAKAKERVIVVRSADEASKALERIETLASISLCFSCDPTIALDVARTALAAWPNTPCLPWALRRARNGTTPSLLGISVRDIESPAAAVHVTLAVERAARARRRLQRAVASLAARRFAVTPKQQTFLELVLMDVPEEDMHRWLGQSPGTHRIFRSALYHRCQITNGFPGLQALLRSILVDALIGRAVGTPWLSEDLSSLEALRPLLDEIE